MSVSADTLVTVLAVVIGALVNAAVTWGVITERMRGLRRDVDRAQLTAERAHQRVDNMPRAHG